MRHFIIAFMLSGLAAARAEESDATAPAPDKARLRAETNRIYNSVFSRNFLIGPEEAEEDFKKAQTEIARINPSDPGDPAMGRILFHRGYLAVEAGRFQEAITLYEELLDRFPMHAYADDALYRIGVVYQRHLRDYTRAAAAYTRLSRKYALRENAPNGQFQNAQIAVQNGNFADANNYLNEAVSNVRRQRNNRGQSPSASNQIELQSDQMIQFINSNRGNPSALTVYFQGLNSLNEQDLTQAQDSFERIKKEFSNTKLADDAAFGLAECARLAGKLTEASAAYEFFLRDYPQSGHAAMACFHLGAFKQMTGDEAMARRLYDRVLALTEKEAGLTPELRRIRRLSTRRLEELGASNRAPLLNPRNAPTSP